MVTEFPVTLERGAARSLPAQLTAEVRRAIGRGVLAPGDVLPSTRDLAARLKVSRGTVTTAYEVLIGEGYLVAVDRSRTVVSQRLPGGQRPAAVTSPALSLAPVAEPAPLDLSPGPPGGAPLSDPSWRRCWRQASQPTGVRRRPDPAGEPELRTAIAEHLRIQRGMVVDPAQVVVTAGAREGLGVLLQSLPGGAIRVGVENPGFPGLRNALRRQQAHLVEIEIDDAGVRLDALPEDLELLVLTPNHLYPHGGSMPADRRLELLRWASSSETLLLEDDYDAEFLHHPAVSTLHGMLPGAPVVHLGTFSRVLGADIGTGYLVVPPDRIEPLLQARRDLGPPVAAITQRAVAGYLAEGGLRRHLRRSRRLIDESAERAITALQGIAAVEVVGAMAVIPLDPERSAAVRAACLSKGVRLGDADARWVGARSSGITVGLGAGAEELQRGLSVLRRALRTAKHPA